MPKKTVPKETMAASPVRAAKPKAPRSTPAVAVVSTPRVKSVKHSRAAAPAVAGTVAPNAHERIAQIAYGYWEARGFQPGSPEEDWLRAEREYLQRA